MNQIANWCYRFVVDGGTIFLQEHLPLHVCGMSAILSVVVLFTRNRLAYELVYFWGLAGATNAVVTPALDAGWPEFHFIQYYISHCGIVVTAVLMTWGLGIGDLQVTAARLLLLNAMAAVMTDSNLLTGPTTCTSANSRSRILLPVLRVPWYILCWRCSRSDSLRCATCRCIWNGSGGGRVRTGRAEPGNQSPPGTTAGTAHFPAPQPPLGLDGLHTYCSENLATISEGFGTDDQV